MKEQRVEFINSRGLKLVGDLSNASSTEAVIVSHGFMSDRNGRGRFPALAAALGAAGISTLRFDYAGCGESQDEVLTPDGMRDDLHSAIRFMGRRGFSWIGLYGHSLGGLISQRAMTPEVNAIAVTGAVTGLATYRFEAYFPPQMMAEFERTGLMNAPGRSEHREVIRASRELIMSFNETSTEELLHTVRLPILMIFGEGDEEEKMLSAVARKAIEHYPAGSELKVYPEAPHDMQVVWPTVTEKIVGWFKARRVESGGPIMLSKDNHPD